MSERRARRKRGLENETPRRARGGGLPGGASVGPRERGLFGGGGGGGGGGGSRVPHGGRGHGLSDGSRGGLSVEGVQVRAREDAEAGVGGGVHDGEAVVSLEALANDRVVELELGRERLRGAGHDVPDEAVRVEHARDVHVVVPARGVVRADRGGDPRRGRPVPRPLERRFRGFALEREAARGGEAAGDARVRAASARGATRYRAPGRDASGDGDGGGHRGRARERFCPTVVVFFALPFAGGFSPLGSKHSCGAEFLLPAPHPRTRSTWSSSRARAFSPRSLSFARRHSQDAARISRLRSRHRSSRARGLASRRATRRRGGRAVSVARGARGRAFVRRVGSDPPGGIFFPRRRWARGADGV